MTGKAVHIASVLSANTVAFDFPYQGEQRGELVIRRHPRHGGNVALRIERGQLLCAAYLECHVLVRFDNGPPSVFAAAPPSDQSTETIFIEDYARFVSKMRTATHVRISPKVYQQGNVVFTFDVKGFDIARFRGE